MKIESDDTERPAGPRRRRLRAVAPSCPTTAAPLESKAAMVEGLDTSAPVAPESGPDLEGQGIVTITPAP